MKKRPQGGITPMRLLGIAMTSGGGAFLGSAISREIKTTHGEHYYDWMIIGALVVVTGFIVLIRSNRKPTN